MSLEKLYIRYAQALYQSAKKKGCITPVVADVEFLMVLCKAPGFVQLLKSPLYRVARKSALLTSLLEKHLHPETLTFLLFLTARRRIPYLKSILRRFQELHAIERKIAKAYLTTTQPISPTLREKVIAHIQAITSEPNIELVETQDPSLIGGYVFKVGDQQLDMSIRTQLKRLQSHWEASHPITHPFSHEK